MAFRCLLALQRPGALRCCSSRMTGASHSQESSDVCIMLLPLPLCCAGIRQRLLKASQDNKWWDKYKIALGQRHEVQGSYTELLSSSVFCMVLPGAWLCAAEGCLQSAACMCMLLQSCTETALLATGGHVCRGLGV